LVGELISPSKVCNIFKFQERRGTS